MKFCWKISLLRSWDRYLSCLITFVLQRVYELWKSSCARFVVRNGVRWSTGKIDPGKTFLELWPTNFCSRVISMKMFFFKKNGENKKKWVRGFFYGRGGTFASFKTHANRPSIVCQQYATLLDPTCCVRLHGTTTMFALVVSSLRPVKLLGPCKWTQHCCPKTPNNTQQCWDFSCCVRLHGPLFLLGLVSQGCLM